MVDRKKFNQTIIEGFENVIKKTNNNGNCAALMKKEELWTMVAEEPGPKIGVIYSNKMIAEVIRSHLKNIKNEHNPSRR